MSRPHLNLLSNKILLKSDTLNEYTLLPQQQCKNGFENVFWLAHRATPGAS